MPEFWTLLPLEVQVAIIALAIWAGDSIATRTPNPFDNLLVRGLKKLRDRMTDHGA